MFTVLGIVLMVGNVVDLDASVLAVPVFLAVTVPLLWRTRAPLPAAGVSFGALALHAVLFGTQLRCGVVFPLAFVVAFAAGSRLDLRLALAGLGPCLGMVLVVAASDSELGFEVVPVLGPMTAGFWAVGRVARSRGRLADALRDRTTELQTARDERARIEVATDRAQLSGRLDALVQRRLSQLAQLADAGTDASEADAAAAALVHIEQQSRRTLEDMRAVVGSLRSEDGHAPVTAQPALTHLEALLLRAKGADARLRFTGSPRALPPGVELSAYRIVEHLLDALDDTLGVAVEVGFADDALEITVSGQARRRSAGAAFDRARERVELHHGTLRSTTRSGRAVRHRAAARRLGRGPGLRR